MQWEWEGAFLVEGRRGGSYRRETRRFIHVYYHEKEGGAPVGVALRKWGIEGRHVCNDLGARAGLHSTSPGGCGAVMKGKTGRRSVYGGWCGCSVRVRWWGRSIISDALGSFDED